MYVATETHCVSVSQTCQRPLAGRGSHSESRTTCPAGRGGRPGQHTQHRQGSYVRHALSGDEDCALEWSGGGGGLEKTV